MLEQAASEDEGIPLCSFQRMVFIQAEKKTVFLLRVAYKKTQPNKTPKQTQKQDF